MTNEWMPEQVSGFTSEEVSKLVQAPYILFLIFHAPTGDILAANPLHLYETLNTHKELDNPLLSELSKMFMGNTEAVADQLFSDDFQYRDKVMEFRDIVDSNLSAEESTAFKKALSMMGRKAAELSTGGELTEDNSNKLLSIIKEFGLVDALI